MGKNSITWHYLGHMSSDGGPGASQSWHTSLGRDKDGNYHASVRGTDGEGDWEIGTAKDVIEWLNDEGWDLYDLKPMFQEHPALADIVALLKDC